MKSPAWLNAMTFTLVCYDVVAGLLFCWMWVRGHLGWIARDRARDSETMEMQRLRGQRGERPTLMEEEMRRLGMV
jgi:hypothetical protein